MWNQHKMNWFLTKFALKIPMKSAVIYRLFFTIDSLDNSVKFQQNRPIFFRKSVVLIGLTNKSIVCHPWTPWQDFFVGVTCNLAFHPSFPQINKWEWSFAFHQSASHVPTQEERDWAREETKRRKEYEQNASEERKNFMQTMELKRKENAKPSDLEQVNNCINWKMKNIKFIN